MTELFDKRQIVYENSFTESYIGYGKNDLSKMTKKELHAELKRVEEDIKNLTSEIEDADSYPSYALKERLENAIWYRDKVIAEIGEDRQEIKESSHHIFKTFKKKLKDYKK